MPYDEVKKIVNNLKIKNQTDYLNWKRGKLKHKPPQKMPGRPDIIYSKNGWVDWDHFWKIESSILS